MAGTSRKDLKGEFISATIYYSCTAYRTGRTVTAFDSSMPLAVQRRGRPLIQGQERHRS